MARFGNTVTSVLLGAAAIVLCRCGGGTSSQTENPPPSSAHFLSPETQANIQTIVPSVVGVSAYFEYRIEFFQYETVGGKYVHDPLSPTGYRLLKQGGIATSEKNQEVNGGGLLIYRDERRALVLTNHHILVHPDTILSYYRESDGSKTDALYSRALQTRSHCEVIGENNQGRSAEVLRTEPRFDLGLVLVEGGGLIGAISPFGVAYRRELRWGDVGLAFGYPHGVKQLSFGIISPSPYPTTFTLDVVARFGFSGGPVFVTAPGNELLLAGIIRGVPSNKHQFVVPPAYAVPGQYLVPTDIGEMRAEEIDLIDYGTTFAIGAETIGRFLQDSNPTLERKGIYLATRFLP